MNRRALAPRPALGWAVRRLRELPTRSPHAGRQDQWLRELARNRGEPGVGSDYGLAFHGEQYVRTRSAEVFEVAHIAPRALTGWPDVVVCRKR